MNAPTREIADQLSSETGLHSTKDIRNRIDKYQDDIHGDEEDINEFFNDIIQEGGNVAAKYDENRRVRVLLVQTNVQKTALDVVRPNMFFTDTTFGTNA